MLQILMTRIPSSKGNLSARIHYAEGEQTGRLAVLCPGYLDSQDYEHLTSLAIMLSRRGYTVVRFDPTGTWDSDGLISDYTTTQYLEDVRNVISFMLNGANYQHILIGGHSRGGLVSILYAARDPRISLVLGIMPSSTRKSPLDNRYREWDKTGESISHRDLPSDRSRSREYRVPLSHATDKAQYDVLSDVKRIRAPIIVITGQLDATVPPEHVKEIFDNANEPKRFMVVPGIDHDYRLNSNKVKLVNEAVLALLQSVDDT